MKLIGIIFTLLLLSSNAYSAEPYCVQSLASLKYASYNEVLEQMKKDPYNPDQLPIRPISLFRTIAKKMIPEFFVGKRSVEILQEKNDYREEGLPKPVHPMGVGFEGVFKLNATRWSGAFKGGEFPVLVRASISQGNPLKVIEPSSLKKFFGAKPKAQERSTAFAIKIYENSDLNLPQKSANIVFQNDLNGEITKDGTAVNWTETTQTNHPPLNLLKLRHFYQWATLVGIAKGSITTLTDHTSKFPFINPQLRPVHSMAELGETNPADVKVPVWVMLRPSNDMETVIRDDFRNELVDTAAKNGELIYEFFAADSVNTQGEKQWEHVGQLYLKNAILSRGVDENVLFPHDTIKSIFTGKEIRIPK